MKFIFPVVVLIILCSCNRQGTLFEKISSSHSHISFANQITESDSINPIDMEFLYNGGGVAVGDFNNDGKQDLYFTASQVSNKMYLNEGNFKFRDITETAKVTGEGRWCNAASVVDINNDGWEDLYVCTTIKKNADQRRNLLYINQGLDKDGVPVFKEMAAEYNLADTGFSVHAAFFDYDRDGDLDMYLLTTTLALRNSSRFDGSDAEQKKGLSDKLFRNEGSDSLGHPWFTDVSALAGIHDDGYGLGIGIADLNNDGWKDIYTCNDFYSSDQLYINNGNGTFTDQAKISFRHTSQNSMGNDIADINNDGLPDIISVDMNPEVNYRKKTNMGGINYYIPIFMVTNGKVLQYVRNTLQLNNGVFTHDSSSTPLPTFSDIAFYSGVAETDWSWNTSLADFDNDGNKDLIITNGYPKDVTDRDFIIFRLESRDIATREQLFEQLPQIKIPNYAYRNTGDLKFENVTKNWGLNQPCFSNGAVYADLDDDGDLDYVINNINEEAFIYKNTSEKNNKNNYLNIGFKGSPLNVNGLGAITTLYYDQGKKQVFENSPYRGYLSTVAPSLHFGLGTFTSIDSLRVTWPDGKEQLIRNIKANQALTINYSDANDMKTAPAPVSPLFSHITKQAGIHFIHQEFDHIDFNDQWLLPHKLSQYGPSIAAADVDHNGMDDLFVGASASTDAHFLLQQPGGIFQEQTLVVAAGGNKRMPEMMGTLLFDADSDGDPDLIAASGSTEFAPNTPNYRDLFFTNDGKGKFSYDSSALPINLASKSCVKAADFDHDGDLDLFIGGRVQPQKYPEPVSSFLYRNDSHAGTIKFTDVTHQFAPGLVDIGLTCDAIWTDIDNDSWPDLLIAGEWMPVTVLKNNKGKFADPAMVAGLENKKGWWNSITSGDFDNDGDIDYVLGNLGLNSFLRASEKEPVRIYSGDFNKDGTYDVLTTLYLPDQDGNRKEFPANTRDDIMRQMVNKRKIFDTYRKFAVAGINEVLTPDERKIARVLEANYFASCLMVNDGKGRFALKPLPMQAQLAPLNGMVADDVNGDGNLDLILNGNDYGNEVVNGRYDAMSGLVLLGNGNGGFTALTIQESGLFVPNDGKGLAALVSGNQYAVAATQNRSTLELFSLPTQNRFIRFQPGDITALIKLKNGKVRKFECVTGSSFLSQSSAFLAVTPAVQQVDIINSKGERRVVYK